MELSGSDAEGVERAARAFVERRRPPEHLRDRVDVDFRVDEGAVVIFERRPWWRDPQTLLEIPIAKASFDADREAWRVFSRDSEGDWRAYAPRPEVATFGAFLELLEADTGGSFWG